MHTNSLENKVLDEKKQYDDQNYLGNLIIFNFLISMSKAQSSELNSSTNKAICFVTLKIIDLADWSSYSTRILDRSIEGTSNILLLLVDDDNDDGWEVTFMDCQIKWLEYKVWYETAKKKLLWQALHLAPPH